MGDNNFAKRNNRSRPFYVDATATVARMFASYCRNIVHLFQCSNGPLTFSHAPFGSSQLISCGLSYGSSPIFSNWTQCRSSMGEWNGWQTIPSDRCQRNLVHAQ